MPPQNYQTTHGCRALLVPRVHDQDDMIVLPTFNKNTFPNFARARWSSSCARLRRGRARHADRRGAGADEQLRQRPAEFAATSTPRPASTGRPVRSRSAVTATAPSPPSTRWCTPFFKPDCRRRRYNRTLTPSVPERAARPLRPATSTSRCRRSYANNSERRAADVSHLADQNRDRSDQFDPPLSRAERRAGRRPPYMLTRIAGRWRETLLDLWARWWRGSTYVKNRPAPERERR